MTKCDLCGKGWTVDVFGARVPDHNEAHLEVKRFETMEAALAYIGGWGDVE